MAVHERVARFPTGRVRQGILDSDIADLKNLGGDLAGAITAGKFLARFTTRPYIHLDIAGPAFLHKPEPGNARHRRGRAAVLPVPGPTRIQMSEERPASGSASAVAT